MYLGARVYYGFHNRTAQQTREEYEKGDHLEAFISKECLIDKNNPQLFTPATEHTQVDAKAKSTRQ
ncbi:MAG: hypothetical protein WCC17_00220 [Candidatus Nitrosopolaris sp.]